MGKQGIGGALMGAVALLVVVPMVAGCDGNPGGSRAIGLTAGSAAGAGIGALANSDSRRGAAAGLAIGAAVGYAISTYWDDTEAQERHAQATVTAAETAQSVRWTSAKGAYGEVRPADKGFEDLGGRWCQPLHQEWMIDQDTLSRDVTACRTEGQDWVVTEERPQAKDEG